MRAQHHTGAGGGREERLVVDRRPCRTARPRTLTGAVFVPHPYVLPVVGALGTWAHRLPSARKSVWARLHRAVLDELGSRGRLDWSRCAIDSVSIRALKGGKLTGSDPTDRGKKGSKIHLICDRTGLPISLAISGANLHDSQALEPSIRGVPSIRSRRGPRRRRPAKLHGDKGYAYDHLRRRLRERGIVPRIARRGIESSQRLGSHRRVVERTMSRLAGCRRLHRRYERKAERFLAFAGISAVLICLRRLVRADAQNRSAS
ncbi:IS5 family transposase [Streptomyces sp. NPDC002698]|uniref:IS5 family transposase n=1 Tax=Streptomyces sp. NPDC002698 TaxID=3364660 RepID=UPI0036935786